MKKKLIVILAIVLLFVRCSSDKNESVPSVTGASDTTVLNVSKKCDMNLTSNIVDFKLCQQWKVPSIELIKQILRNSRKAENNEVFNLINPRIPSWVFSQIKIGNQLYSMEINGYSYFYFMEKKNKVLYIVNKKLQESFIRKMTEEDDENFNKREALILQQLKLSQTDLTPWKGEYQFKTYMNDAEVNYTLIVNEKQAFVKSIDPKINNIPVFSEILNQEVFFYLNTDEIDYTNTSASWLNESRNGDFIFSIVTKNNKTFLNKFNPRLRL